MALVLTCQPAPVDEDRVAWGDLVPHDGTPGAHAGPGVNLTANSAEVGATLSTSNGTVWARAFVVAKMPLRPNKAVLHVLDMGVYVNGSLHRRGARVLLFPNDRLELRARVGRVRGEIMQLDIGNSDQVARLNIFSKNLAWRWRPGPSFLHACEKLLSFDDPEQPLDRCPSPPSGVSHAWAARWAKRAVPQLEPRTAPRTGNKENGCPAAGRERRCNHDAIRQSCNDLREYLGRSRAVAWSEARVDCRGGFCAHDCVFR